MSGVQFATAVEYSRLEKIIIENFMSIEYAELEFDERGILNLKGFNDVGKSNIARSQEVLLDNAHASKQLKFIRDDTEYFKITDIFSDGVRVEYSKFISGKSLYELYQNDKLLFTTKVNDSYTKITNVPQPIKDYLAMISEDDFFLNVRSCYQPQILVDTSGGKNYKFLSGVLHSEELALAHTMMNTDKNAKYAELNNVEATLRVRKADLDYCPDITLDLVEFLEAHDLSLNELDESLSELEKISEVLTLLQSVVVYPRMAQVDMSCFNDLNAIENIFNSMSQIVIPPRLQKLDSSILDNLDELISIHAIYTGIKDLPKISPVSVDELKDIEELVSLQRGIADLHIYPQLKTVHLDELSALDELTNILSSISDIDAKEQETQNSLASLRNEVVDIESKLNSVGVRTIKCTNCGTVLEVS